MAGFESLYKQAVTIFNREIDANHGCVWNIRHLEGVHLIIDKSAAWDMQGGRATDNVRLHIRYIVKNGHVHVGEYEWVEPKVFRTAEEKEHLITFGYGNNDDFDFFIAGEWNPKQIRTQVADDAYKSGFYNYMNRNFDNVFVITGVSKKNLIPHFEITGR